MTDPDRQKDDPGTRQASEPVVSKPYIMPDDPEQGSAEALAKEAAESRDKMLRTLAEMENLRKRTSREVADARTYGITGFARDVLDIADNLQRALDAVPAETKAPPIPALKALIEGVELTERSLLNTLEKNGVKKFDPSGEKFDPNFQQAMYEVPDPSVPSGTVVQVVQAGYMIGDRVLRPALVGVSKGGAKAARAGNEPNGPREPRTTSRLKPTLLSAARLNAVAHGAEARKRLRPLVARRAADDAQRVRAAEPQPLHHGDGGIVLAADRIDPRFIAGHAVDADRLRHRDPRVAHAGNRGRGLLGKPAAISGCAGVDPIMPIIMKGAGSKPAVSSPSARMMAAPGASVRTFLKSPSSLILNGISPSCSSTGTSLRITADANICRTASSV